jgi:hypothetical protein
MDELDLFRDFRSGVAAPSEDAQRRASARLGRAVGREQTPGTSAPRLIAKLGGYRVLALAALAGATATALFVSTPWKTSASFLERAQAALTPPPGMILHKRWETTMTSTDPACTVTRGPSEMWIDQKPPYRYRLLTSDLGGTACASGAAAEFGGTLDQESALRFVPPNTLIGWRLRFPSLRDPETRLREAISAGTAHDEGKTELDGRTVERIRIDPPSDCPSCEPAYVYVDPDTFYPVRTESAIGVSAQAGGPFVVRFHVVQKILTYEYLPRIAANLALTDILAQHPNATGP